VEELVGCLQHVLGDAALREHMAWQARPSVERFRWSRIAEDYLALFREAIMRREAPLAAPRQATWRNVLGWLAGRLERAA
jgi:hypothetical protein